MFESFLYWEDIEKEKQNTILKSKEVNIDVRKTYFRTFSPSDDEKTANLLNTLSKLHHNDEIKALYFYVFNNILKIADGALTELFRDPCVNILISNSEYVIFYLQEKPKLLEKYALVLGYEFYFKEEGTSDLEYDYSTFKKIINNEIKNNKDLQKTFSILCYEIEEVKRYMKD